MIEICIRSSSATWGRRRRVRQRTPVLAQTGRRRVKKNEAVFQRVILQLSSACYRRTSAEVSPSRETDRPRHFIGSTHTHTQSLEPNRFSRPKRKERNWRFETKEVWYIYIYIRWRDFMTFDTREMNARHAADNSPWKPQGYQSLSLSCWRSKWWRSVYNFWYGILPSRPARRWFSSRRSQK